jgi:hypothetical protein
MKGVYGLILSHMHSCVINTFSKFRALENFNSVLIEDSTVLKLNEKLQEDFQGTNRGGTGAKSQAKIDVIYDLVKGVIVNAEIYNGKDPDQGLASRILPFVKPGDLVIRDLGYFVLKSFYSFIKLEAYFISRLLPHVKIYLNGDDLKPINLEHYLDKHYSGHSIIDIPQMFFGDEKIPLRLVLYRLPKDVVEAKLREANKRAKETGRKMSHQKKLLLHFAAFVTNATENLLSAEIIGTIYRLRWEIELIFKRWKSQLKLDYLKGVNKNRIECLIWSRLSSVLLIEMINGHIAMLASKIAKGIEVSHVKIIDYILRQSKFYASVAQNHLEEFFKVMEEDIPRMLLKDKRDRKTMREKVIILESYYGMQPSVFQKVALA